MAGLPTVAVTAICYILWLIERVSRIISASSIPMNGIIALRLVVFEIESFTGDVMAILARR